MTSHSNFRADDTDGAAVAGTVATVGDGVGDGAVATASDDRESTERAIVVVQVAPGDGRGGYRYAAGAGKDGDGDGGDGHDGDGDGGDGHGVGGDGHGADDTTATANTAAELTELTDLTHSAGVVVCEQVIVRRGKPSAATFVGAGKARELAAAVSRHGATLVVFGHAITPVQERNLERIVNCRVLDRTALILDIFAQRARTAAGKLQVELAQLKHLSTRLVRGWSHLERQKGGVGLRGPGETQLETDRRLIGVRIKSLTRALRKVESQRRLRRRARERAALPTVSLVGYTNAGKSLLFNRLTGGASARAADQLFATLDPTMRRVDIPGFGPALLSDTVGFIRELPHTLINAFHSTLEDIAGASCLLVVNDCADDDDGERRAAVAAVLLDIGAGEVPVIQVNNKIDLTGDAARVRRRGGVGTVWVSAKRGDGVGLLLDALAAQLGRRRRQVELRLRPEAGALRARLYQRCEVIDEEVDAGGGIRLRLRMERADRGWLESRAEFAGLWSVG